MHDWLLISTCHQRSERWQHRVFVRNRPRPYRHRPCLRARNHRHAISGRQTYPSAHCQQQQPGRRGRRCCPQAATNAESPTVQPTECTEGRSPEGIRVSVPAHVGSTVLHRECSYLRCVSWNVRQPPHRECCGLVAHCPSHARASSELASTPGPGIRVHHRQPLFLRGEVHVSHQHHLHTPVYETRDVSAEGDTLDWLRCHHAHRRRWQAVSTAAGRHPVSTANGRSLVGVSFPAHSTADRQECESPHAAHVDVLVKRCLTVSVECWVQGTVDDHTLDDALLLDCGSCTLGCSQNHHLWIHNVGSMMADYQIVSPPSSAFVINPTHGHVAPGEKAAVLVRGRVQRADGCGFCDLVACCRLNTRQRLPNAASSLSSCALATRHISRSCC